MPRDHVITDADFPTTDAKRWDANIAAIRLSQKLEEERRPASRVEKQVLAQYSGFGGAGYEKAFKQWVEPGPWKRRIQELEELTTDEELRAIRLSRLNAFYTTPELVNSMWDTLNKMGADKLKNPKVLEPSAGSGRFLGLQPKGMADRSERTAVELDRMTARILKPLYPEAKVYQAGFQDAPLPDEHYDIAISNVPFGDVKIYDKEYNATGRKYLTNSIHNYFKAKTLDKLRPGGVMAYITTHHAMDAEQAEPVRRYIADRADLLGAVRLPKDAFPDTSVVADIMYLRKREEGEEPGDDSWVKTKKIPIGRNYDGEISASVSQYFLDNPDKVLGTHGVGGMYREAEYTVQKDPERPVIEALAKEHRRIVRRNADAVRPASAASLEAARARGEAKAVAAAGPPKYVLRDGKLQLEQAGKTSDHALNAKTAGKVTDLLELQTTARRLVDQESTETDSKAIEGTRTSLGEMYDKYVETHGEAINTPANRRLLGNDADDHLLFALEHYDRKTECWQPADIMKQRVVGVTPPQKVNTAADAMQVSMNESGKLDFKRMGEMLDRGPAEVRDELADDKLIFKSPSGDGVHIPANEYLTGNVREKLKTAGIASQLDPTYLDHVEALKEVQPKRVTAEDIASPLGAPWIPADVINQFTNEEFRLPTMHWRGRDKHKTGQYFRYLDETESFIGENEKGNKVTKGGTGGGGWTLAEDFKPQNDYADITYGLGKRMSAKNILLKTLQGSPITVTKPNPDPNGTARVPDAEGTLEAREKADALQQAFNEWIWKDASRRERLEGIYNDTHNAMRPRIFDGSHQTFPGMAAQWQKQMHPHQRDAILRTVQDGTTLLAHEVGFGKSATMIASAMERKRLGLANKPVFVVPKATHEQFVGQVMEVYPGARVLAPDATSFQKGKREIFLNQIATGDWDGVVLSYEQFEKIPLSPETEAKWIEQQKTELAGSLMEIKAEDDGSKQTERTQNQIEKKLENYDVKLKQLADKMADRSDDTRTFESLGIDQLYVDEADNYKNLPYVTKMTAGRAGVKGLPQTEAQKSWDMYMKIRYLQDKSGQKPDGNFAKGGVVFATGTPVANTIAETYTMMRYLQPDELKRRGLDTFDAWAKTYGHVKSGMEYTAGGKYKTVQRFSRFVNLPELSTLFQNVADIRVASEVPEMLAAQPRLVDEKGDPKRTTVVAPAHPALDAYMKSLIERVDKLGAVPPEEDNMLKIASDARKASMDVRMVNPSAPYHAEGKVQLAAGNIAEIFKEEAKDKGTQLVFLDLGTPKEAKGKDADDANVRDDEDLTGEEQELLTNVYGQLREELKSRGVPDDQIAFIHDYKTAGAKEEILDNVRDGDVRVLIGSTAKLGVGINVQDRAAAAHHIDVPWRPRDVEQREGRVIRQGNEVYGPELTEDEQVIGPGKGVRIFQYVQERSFDRFMWQAVEEKARGIKALMKREQPHREMEDIDELVIGASEAKALASGDPLAIRAEELRQNVDMLRLSASAHKRRRFEAESQSKFLDTQIGAYEKNKPGLDVDAKHVEALPADADFAATFHGKAYEKRAEAATPLARALQDESYDPLKSEKVMAGDPDWFKPIGEFKGFEVGVLKDHTGRKLVVRHPETMQPHASKPIEESASEAGIMTRLDNLVKSLPRRAADTTDNLERARENVKLYRAQLSTPFEDAPALNYAESQLRVIRSRLADDPKILRDGDDPKMNVEDDWRPGMAISAPVKTPTETPREIPDAGPVDMQEAVEAVRSEDAADTPADVADVASEAIGGDARREQLIRHYGQRLEAEGKDAVLDELRAAQAAKEAVEVPVAELDAIAAEFNFGSFNDLPSNMSNVVTELYRARAGVDKGAEIKVVEPGAQPEPKPATDSAFAAARQQIREQRVEAEREEEPEPEVVEIEDTVELTDADHKGLRDRAFTAVYNRELAAGKGPDEALKEGQFVKALYAKNEGRTTREQLEAVIATDPGDELTKGGVEKAIADTGRERKVKGELPEPPDTDEPAPAPPPTKEQEDGKAMEAEFERLKGYPPPPRMIADMMGESGIDGIVRAREEMARLRRGEGTSRLRMPDPSAAPAEKPASDQPKLTVGEAETLLVDAMNEDKQYKDAWAGLLEGRVSPEEIRAEYDAAVKRAVPQVSAHRPDMATEYPKLGFRSELARGMEKRLDAAIRGTEFKWKPAAEIAAKERESESAPQMPVPRVQEEAAKAKADTDDRIAAPVEELDKLAAEFDWLPYRQLDNDQQITMLRLYLDRKGLPDTDKVYAADGPAAAAPVPDPKPPGAEAKPSSSEMLESAKDGPVALTGPGSVMERVQEEKAEARAPKEAGTQESVDAALSRQIQERPERIPPTVEPVPDEKYLDRQGNVVNIKKMGDDDRAVAIGYLERRVKSQGEFRDRSLADGSDVERRRAGRASRKIARAQEALGKLRPEPETPAEASPTSAEALRDHEGTRESLDQGVARAVKVAKEDRESAEGEEAETRIKILKDLLSAGAVVGKRELRDLERSGRLLQEGETTKQAYDRILNDQVEIREKRGQQRKERSEKRQVENRQRKDEFNALREEVRGLGGDDDVLHDIEYGDVERVKEYRDELKQERDKFDAQDREEAQQQVEAAQKQIATIEQDIRKGNTVELKFVVGGLVGKKHNITPEAWESHEKEGKPLLKVGDGSLLMLDGDEYISLSDPKHTLQSAKPLSAEQAEEHRTVEKRQSANAARRATAKAKRDAERPQKLADNWGEPTGSAEDITRNLAHLRRMDASDFPPGEHDRILKVWETAANRPGPSMLDDEPAVVEVIESRPRQPHQPPAVEGEQPAAEPSTAAPARQARPKWAGRRNAGFTLEGSELRISRNLGGKQPYSVYTEGGMATRSANTFRTIAQAKEYAESLSSTQVAEMKQTFDTQSGRIQDAFKVAKEDRKGTEQEKPRADVLEWPDKPTKAGFSQEWRSGDSWRIYKLDNEEAETYTLERTYGSAPDDRAPIATSTSIEDLKAKAQDYENRRETVDVEGARKKLGLRPEDLPPAKPVHTGPTPTWMKSMLQVAGVYAKGKGKDATPEEKKAARDAQDRALDLVERQAQRLNPEDVGMTEDNSEQVIADQQKRQTQVMKSLATETDPARVKELLTELHGQNLRIEMAHRIAETVAGRKKSEEQSQRVQERINKEQQAAREKAENEQKEANLVARNPEITADVNRRRTEMDEAIKSGDPEGAQKIQNSLVTQMHELPWAVNAKHEISAFVMDYQAKIDKARTAQQSPPAAAEPVTELPKARQFIPKEPQKPSKAEQAEYATKQWAARLDEHRADIEKGGDDRARVIKEMGGQASSLERMAQEHPGMEMLLSDWRGTLKDAEVDNRRDLQAGLDKVIDGANQRSADRARQKGEEEAIAFERQPGPSDPPKGDVGERQQIIGEIDAIMKEVRGPDGGIDRADGEKLSTKELRQTLAVAKHHRTKVAEEAETASRRQVAEDEARESREKRAPGLRARAQKKMDFITANIEQGNDVFLSNALRHVQLTPKNWQKSEDSGHAAGQVVRRWDRVATSGG